MSYKHTSLGRPSQETINQRAIFDRQFEQARALGALIAVHRQIARRIDLNARADELRATGAVDESEGDDFDHERYLAELADAKDDHDYSIPF